MNDYGGLNQCKFIVQAIFDELQTEDPQTLKHSMRLDAPTPHKKSKTEVCTAQSPTADPTNETQDSSTEMETEIHSHIKSKKD